MKNIKKKIEKYSAIFKEYEELYETIPRQFRTLKKKMAIEVGVCMSLKNNNAMIKQKKKSKILK